MWKQKILIKRFSTKRIRKISELNPYKLNSWIPNCDFNGYRKKMINDIISCEDGNQIYNCVEKKLNSKHNVFNVFYLVAMKKCLRFNDIQNCYNIFELCKRNNQLSGPIYGILIWLIGYHKTITSNMNITNKDNGYIHRLRSEEPMKLLKEILKEMKQNNIEISTQNYATLFSVFTQLEMFEEGFKYYRKLKNNHHRNIDFGNIYLWNSIMHLYCKSLTSVYTRSDVAIQDVFGLLNDMYQIYGVKPDFITISTILSMISTRIKIELKYVDKSGYKYINELIDMGRNLFEGNSFHSVYPCMMDIWAELGNIKECYQLLNAFIKSKDSIDINQSNGNSLDGKYPTFEWNKKTVNACFGSCIKVLINQNIWYEYNLKQNNIQISIISYDSAWKMIDLLSHKMNKHFNMDLYNSTINYNLLIHCCDAFETNNLDKAMELYQDMINKNLIPNDIILKTLTCVGIGKYRNTWSQSGISRKMLSAFIRDEMRKYNIKDRNGLLNSKLKELES